MSRILNLCLLLFFCFTRVMADEGMWIPMLLKDMNESRLKEAGCKLTPEQIYDINEGSLKDAVVQFGGGCTGEVISDQGLILTNHHCGFSQIQNHSSIQNDFLKNGFWAMNKEQELPNPGLTVTFIIRMDDVTNTVLKDINDTVSEQRREAMIKKRIAEIEKNSVAGTHYNAVIKPFFTGNAYYLFITEVFRDVRLVGAPPSSIGKFGSDTDNWMWPRHTGDFCLFRIYAGADNKPADYSKSNVPFNPRKSLQIVLKDIKEGDFTMVYGFPAKTNEYLSSYSIAQIRKESNPVKINLRSNKLFVLDSYMRNNDTLRIKYAAKYASTSNAWKKWQGENKGIDRLDALKLKKDLERSLIAKTTSANRYQDIACLVDLEMAMNKFSPLQKQKDYYLEAFMAVDILSFANGIYKTVQKVNNPASNDSVKKAETENLLKGINGFYKNYDVRVDKTLFEKLINIYYQEMGNSLPPELFNELQDGFRGDVKAYSDKLYNKTFLTDSALTRKFIRKLLSNSEKVKNDPIIKLAGHFNEYYQKQVNSPLLKIESELAVLNRKYMAVQMKYISDKKFYPDANSTLRLSFGHVSSYQPSDAVTYQFYTTAKGILEKNNPNLDEFDVPDKLFNLIKQKDFGMYNDANGDLRIAFIASNHTTGGNSGSPVLDAYGRLIGTNFDRNWEGTMSDLIYNPRQVRNIILDIHYTLFVIDKYAGATHLINEMNIVKE